MPNLWDLISKDEQIQSGLEALKGAGRGAARGLTTDFVGAIPDAVAGAMNALGVPVGDTPVGGSKWMRQLLDQPTEDTPAELVGNLLSSFTSPGKAGMDIAGLAPMLAGTFMGPKSKIWNKDAADYFEAMEKVTDDPATLQRIFEQLNVFRSPGDKMLRQEIPDQAAKLKIASGTSGRLKLEDVLDHPDLFKAYPKLRGLQVEARPEHSTKAAAAFDEGGWLTEPLITFNPNSISSRNDLLHEIQHSIQSMENFARGGNWRTMVDTPEFLQAKDITKGNLDDETIARILYKRLSGEAESRLVETRSGFSPEALRQFFPGTYDAGLTAYDVPPNKLINKYK